MSYRDVKFCVLVMIAFMEKMKVVPDLYNLEFHAFRLERQKDTFHRDLNFQDNLGVLQ